MLFPKFFTIGGMRYDVSLYFQGDVLCCPRLLDPEIVTDVGPVFTGVNLRSSGIRMLYQGLQCPFLLIRSDKHDVVNVVDQCHVL